MFIGPVPVRNIRILKFINYPGFNIINDFNEEFQKSVAGKNAEGLQHANKIRSARLRIKITLIEDFLDNWIFICLQRLLFFVLSVSFF